MRLNLRHAALALASAVLLTGAVSPALAKCTKLGFSVNDYGKDGPIKDAKSLLDKYVAKWAQEKGIAKYTIGKKTVNCELFLDLLVFDEHTCKAEALVCWGGDEAPSAAEKPMSKKKKSAKTE